MNTAIYVIVENVEQGYGAIAEDAYECICPALGYYTDPVAVKDKVNSLNYRYFNDNKDNPRFGFIVLEPAK